MSTRFTQEIADYNLSIFEKPNGQPVFEHSSEAIRLLYTLDVHNYVTYISSRTKENLINLFSASEPEAVETLLLAKTDSAPFGGEWFQKVVLGKNVVFAEDVKILAHGGLTIDDGATLGEQAQLVGVGHPMHPAQRHLLMIGPIAIKSKALVGAGTIVLNPGLAENIAVGDHSIVLPGSIVSRSVPDYSVSAGVNKILIQGEQYFNKGVSENTLSARLTTEGLVVLKNAAKELGITLPDGPLTKKTQISLPDGVKIVDHNVTKDLKELAKYFPQATEDQLRTGLFFPPIYIVGNGKIVLGQNILINTGSLLKVDGELVIDNKTFLAPESEITVPQGSRVVFEKSVWCGAKVKVKANPNETIIIGEGSVLAAGAEITRSIPPMSIVVGEGKVVSTLGPENLYKVEDVLNDFTDCEGQRLALREKLAKLNIDDVKESLVSHCKRPGVPLRLSKLLNRL